MSTVECANEVEKLMDEVKNAERIPTYKDADWTQFLLSKLDPSELAEGKYPSVHGLRRLVDTYVGEITTVQAHIVQAPNPANLNTAVVSVQVAVMDSKQSSYKTFTGVADASPRNCDAPYNQFPTSMAETRAFGRALRNMLRINVVTAEEVSKNAEESASLPLEVADTTDFLVEPISDNQIKGLDTMCKKLDVNLISFCNAGEIKYNSIREIKRDKAALMMRTLNEFQNNPKKTAPIELKGFDKNWKLTFGG